MQQKRNIPINCTFNFVCSFVWGFTSHSTIYNSVWNVTINGEGLNFFTFTLSTECTITCHTRQLFIMVTPRTRDIHTCCWAFGSGPVTTCLMIEVRTPICSIRGERSTNKQPRRWPKSLNVVSIEFHFLDVPLSQYVWYAKLPCLLNGHKC